MGVCRKIGLGHSFGKTGDSRPAAALLRLNLRCWAQVLISFNSNLLLKKSVYLVMNHECKVDENARITLFPSTSV